MRNILLIVVISLGAAAMLVSCGQSGASFDAAAHRTEVLEWRAGRLERLIAPTGFLALAGLYWLESGQHSFGSDSANDVVFPVAAAAVIGDFRVSDNGIFMSIADGIEVLSDEAPVQSILIADDTTESPVVITHESLSWIAIKRDDRFAVRLWDTANPALEEFGALPYYDIDAGWKVTARLKRYPEPRTVNVGTVVEGLGWNPLSPGVVEFDVDGTSYELEAYESGERLFLVFGDLTSRDETYGAGRFLYADAPGEDGLTVLDFNHAYSPPCAFNDFATCPVASPRNRLAIRIEAGEKFDPALYHGTAH